MAWIMMEPNSVRDEVEQRIRGIEQRHNSRVFALITEKTLDREFQEAVCRALRSETPVETLHILLNSGGGDIDAIYKMLTRLRRLASTLEVIVPDYAKSGATFFCLGADKIWMSSTAELGPLDAQIPDPRRSGAYMSALDAFKALEYLRRYAMETLDVTVKMVLSRTQMRVEEALQEARSFVSILMTPLYQQVRPLDLGEYNRILAIGEEYGSRVMRRYSYDHLSDDQIRGMLQRMIWSYPSHGFVIDSEEAGNLGLNVELLDTPDEEDALAILGQVNELVGFAPSGSAEEGKDVH